MPIWFPSAPGVTLPSFGTAAGPVTVPPSPTYPAGATITIETYIQHLDDGDDVGQGTTEVAILTPAYNETVRFSAPIRVKLEANKFIRLDYVVGAPTGEFALFGRDTRLYWQQIFNTGAFTVTGLDSGFLVGVAPLVDTGIFNVTGNDVAIDLARQINAQVGTFALTGVDVRFAPLRLDIGAFTFTGFDSTIGLFKNLLADVGSFAFTGNDVSIDLTRKVNADVGAFSLTGNEVRFEPVLTDTGVFTVTGLTADLPINYKLTADVGAFTLTGNDVSISVDRVVSADVGDFSLTGDRALFPVRGDTGAFTVTGLAADLLIGFSVGTDVGVFTLTGNDISFAVDRSVNADTGAFTLTGNDALIAVDGQFILAADLGTFTLTGLASNIAGPDIVLAGTGLFTVTGNPVIIFDASASAYIEEVELIDGQYLEDEIKTAINDFYIGVKADGNYAALKAATLLMGARTRLGSYVDMITANTDLTSFNFVDDDYSRITGLKGDASTKYLESNYAFPTNLQDNCHLSIYDTEVRTTGVNFGYGDVGASGSFVSSPSARLYHESDSTYNFPDTTTPGFRGVSRDNSANYDTRYPPGTNDSFTKVSLAVTHDTFAVFARKRNGPSLDSYCDCRMTFYSAGEDVDLALLDQRVTRMVNLIQYYLYTGEDGAAYDTDTLIYVNNGYANGGGL